MRLKYYLKGFGVGVLFATLILSVSFLFRPAGGNGMTDEEVMLRARELGMETVTTAVQEQTTGAAKETVTMPEGTTAEPKETVAETTPVLPEETTSAVPEPLQEETEDMSAESSVSSEITDDTVIAIQIRSGMSSETVSTLLAEGGVVESAAELNAYLVNNGLSRYIRVGTYEFSKGMSFEDIAAKICR